MLPGAGDILQGKDKECPSVRAEGWLTLTLDLVILLLLHNALTMRIGAVFGPEHMGKMRVRKTTGAGTKIVHSSPVRTQKMPKGSREQEVTKVLAKVPSTPLTPWDRAAAWQRVGCGGAAGVCELRCSAAARGGTAKAACAVGRGCQPTRALHPALLWKPDSTAFFLIIIFPPYLSDVPAKHALLL